MNLTKTQVESVAYKIWGKLNSSATEYNKKVTEEVNKFIDTKINKYAILKDPSVKASAIQVISITYKNEIAKINSQKKTVPTISTLTHDINFCTIESESLSEIIEIIIKKYS